MASASKLTFDVTRSTHGGRDKVQVLAAPGGVITALTAAIKSQHWRSITGASAAFRVLDVRSVPALRVAVWGVGSSTHAPIFQLYGWRETGEGFHVGQVTATMAANVLSVKRSGVTPVGWHTDLTNHQSVRDAFDPDTDYRGCDTYVAGVDAEAAISVFAVNADSPCFFEWSLANSQYPYIAMNCSSLGSATSAGATCWALGCKSRAGSLDGE